MKLENYFYIILITEIRCLTTGRGRKGTEGRYLPDQYNTAVWWQN